MSWDPASTQPTLSDRVRAEIFRPAVWSAIVATQLLTAAGAAEGANLAVADAEVAVAANGVCSLVEAIHNANANADAQVDNTDCPAGTAGLDTIELASASTHTLSAQDSDESVNGLPTITSEVDLVGAGSVIERDAALTCNLDGTHDADEFRLFLVADGGDLARSDLRGPGARGVGDLDHRGDDRAPGRRRRAAAGADRRPGRRLPRRERRPPRDPLRGGVLPVEPPLSWGCDLGRATAAASGGAS